MTTRRPTTRRPTTSAAPMSRESLSHVDRPGTCVVLGFLGCVSLTLAVWPVVYLVSVSDAYARPTVAPQFVAASIECLSIVAGLVVLAPRRRNDHA